MSTKSPTLFDFRKAYEEATAQDAKNLEANISLLTAERQRIKETIDSLKLATQKIAVDLLNSISTYDHVSREFIEFQLNQLLSDLNDQYECLLECYRKQLESIDFSSSSSINTMFYNNFDVVNKEIHNYKDHLTTFQSELSRLLSQSNIRYISFLKNRAQALISQFEHLGIYHEIFTEGKGHVGFIEKRIEDKHAIDGYLYKIDNANLNSIPFVFCPIYGLSAEKKKYYKEKFGKELFQSYYGMNIYRTITNFIEDLAIVLQSLVTGVNITYTGGYTIEITLQEK
jgi:hypothetical protein